MNENEIKVYINMLGRLIEALHEQDESLIRFYEDMLREILANPSILVEMEEME